MFVKHYAALAAMLLVIQLQVTMTLTFDPNSVATRSIDLII